jgi:hypothetical protein
MAELCEFFARAIASAACRAQRVALRQTQGDRKRGVPR